MQVPEEAAEGGTRFGAVGSDVESSLTQAPSGQPGKRALNEEQLIENERERQEALREAFHWSVILFIRAAAIAFLVLILVRASQLILPAAWCWLDDVQLGTIDKLLASGFVGGLVGTYAKQVLPSPP